ncbi:hypothetical protein Q9233_000301 [Columba guinea]|nr:hypothetical protein Q9233_000301 [Columba guinea]
MQLPAVPGALAPSLLAIPVAFGINGVTALADSPLALMLTGVLVLIGLCSIIIFLSGGNHFQDPLFCVFVVFSFTSVADLIISLEEDGFISGFMEIYVREVPSHPPGLPHTPAMQLAAPCTGVKHQSCSCC